MKIHPEDPRLTAFVLGELSPEEAAAVESAIHEDPALQNEVEEIRGLQGHLSKELAFKREKLSPKHRENIRRSARQEARASSPVFRAKEALGVWLIPACAAAVLTIATLILFRMSDDGDSGGEKGTAQSQATIPKGPATGPANPTAAPKAVPVEENDGLPTLVQRGSLNAKEHPEIALPVQAGTESLGTITNSIVKDGKLPSPHAVRLEEVLNSFPIRLSGISAIARGSKEWHPDNRSGEVNPPVASISTETIACPWKPSAILLFISIRGNPKTDAQVSISYKADQVGVARYRLLGFASEEGASAEKMPTNLAANTITTLAIEIEPTKASVNLGSIVWSADGKAAPTISVTHNRETEPSNDARFGAVVCTWAQWLAGEQSGVIDAEIVAALAREIASSELPRDRAEFLTLLDRSLHL